MKFIAMAPVATFITLASAAQGQAPAETVVTPAQPAASQPLVDPQRASDPPVREHGSLRTTEALGAGNVGMSMGGGIAVLLPYYGFEVGAGLTDWLDIVGRFETIIGVFHYPHLGLRAQAFEIGSWRVGVQLLAHYSFFGIKTAQTNFTSTFYLSTEAGISGPVTDDTELMFGVGGEFDFFEYRIVDNEKEVIGTYRYDATSFRAAVKTTLNADLDGYAQARLRVPTETFVFEAQEFYVIPLLEIGGTWTF